MIADRCKSGARRTGYRRYVVSRMHYREKWKQIGDFGPLILSLKETSEYVAQDPVNCFDC